MQPRHWVGLGSSSSTEALVRALRKDSDAGVRSQLAWALGEIGDPAARLALGRVQLRDPAAEVRSAAAWALPRVPVQAKAALGWVARLAPALNQLQPVCWLVLALSLAGAVWLMTRAKSLATVPLRWLHRNR